MTISTGRISFLIAAILFLIVVMLSVVGTATKLPIEAAGLFFVALGLFLG